MSDPQPHRPEDGPSPQPGPSAKGAEEGHDEGNGHRGEPVGAWRRFKDSPYLPAVVLLLILGCASGLFAGSYTYAMANPTPRHIPSALVGPVPDQKEALAFAQGMEKALGSSLDVELYADYGAARKAVEEQKVFTVMRFADDGTVRLDVASAAGSSVAQVLEKAAPAVGKKTGAQVEVRDIKPLGEGDPRGLSIFYMSLAAVIIGFVGAIQLSVHARRLTPLERIGFIALNGLVGGLVISTMVGVVLDAVDLPFVHAWMILALTMFASGMTFTMFNTLFGRWAMIPTWGVMVLLGNPSSGGAVSWPLLPSPFGTIGRWLPPGAAVNALHTAVYYPGYLHLQPYLVLAAWALVSCAVFWGWRHRHPGGRPAAGGAGHAGATGSAAVPG